MRIFFICMILSGLFNMAVAQDTLWTRSVDLGATEEGIKTLQAGDGNYITISSTNASSANFNIGLSKINPSGNILWTKTYDSGLGSATDKASDIIQTSDGNYLLLGTTTINTFPRDLDFFLIKTDTSGNELWRKHIGTDQDDGARAVIELADGNLLIAGYTNDDTLSTNGKKNVYIIKTDASGNVLSQKSYGADKDDEPWDMISSFDGGALITGAFIESFTTKVYILKIDAQGDTLWTTTFDGGDGGIGYGITTTADSNYLVVGKTINNTQVIILKVDQAGNKLWNSSYLHPNHTTAIGNDVTLTPAGEFLITGQAGNDWLLIRTDENGNAIWALTGGDASLTEVGNDVLVDAENHFLMTGVNNFNMGDIQLVKAFDCLDVDAACAIQEGFAGDTTYFSGSADFGHPPYTYTWSGDDGLFSNDPNPGFVYSAPGTYNYKLVIEDVYGCKDSCSGQTDILSSISDLESNGLIQIYPNPTKDKIYIQGAFNSRYEIRDISGRLIESSVTDKELTAISVAHLHSGVYVVKITGINPTPEYRKFVISK